MKKTIRILTLLTLVIVSAAPSIAQLRYGFRFGGSFATPSLRNAKDYKLINRSGFSGGMMLEYTLPETGAAADIAVLFTRYSTRLEMPGGGRMSFGRNFIEVPLHLKYKFWLPAFSNTVAPVVYTGPSLMIKTDRVKNDSPMTTMRLQPGWDVGVGIDIINFIQVTAGYRFGLGNAVKSFPERSDAVMLTNGWNLSVSLLFDF